MRYDYNAPEQLPAALHGTFDCVVIDPPFITREVWAKYAQAAKLLLQPGGEAGDTRLLVPRGRQPGRGSLRPLECQCSDDWVYGGAHGGRHATGRQPVRGAGPLHRGRRR